MKTPVFFSKINSGRASLFAALLALTLALPAGATTYYSVGSLNPSVTTSWTNSAGVNPGNFTTAGDVFEILPVHIMTNASPAWVVTGAVVVDAGGSLVGNQTPGMTMGLLTNYGTIRLTYSTVARTLTLNGNLDNRGTITTSATAANTIRFSANATWTGNGNVGGSRIQLTVDAGVTLDITGLTNSLTLSGAGTGQVST